MQIFISWSGERGNRLATALGNWLPLVIQSVQPWLSSEDIHKGARWLEELSRQLENINMGIICVTPESMDANWLQFEAGALSKVVKSSFVCTFLYELGPEDVKGPLSQFQATRANRKDIKKLLDTINKKAGSQLRETQLDYLFTSLWPDFEKKLSSVNIDVPTQRINPRPVPELLGEVIERIRSIERQIVDKGVDNLTEMNIRGRLGLTSKINDVFYAFQEYWQIEKQSQEASEPLDEELATKRLELIAKIDEYFIELDENINERKQKLDEYFELKEYLEKL